MKSRQNQSIIDNVHGKTYNIFMIYVYKGDIMLRFVLCDDEPITLQYYFEYITKQMRKLKSECTVDMYTDSGELLSDLYHGQRWDVYFLDIDMPLIGGLDLGKKIREFDRECCLVYISIHTEKVWDSLENRPFRFIPKDEFSLRIDACLRDILEEYRKEKDRVSLILDTQGQIFRFVTDDILYIQSLDKYVQIFLKDGAKTDAIRYRMSDLEKKLSSHGFIRIHRSYLVNYLFIRSIHPTELLMDNGTRLPVSRLRLDEIKATYRRLTL